MLQRQLAKFQAFFPKTCSRFREQVREGPAQSSGGKAFAVREREGFRRPAYNTDASAPWNEEGVQLVVKPGKTRRGVPQLARTKSNHASDRASLDGSMDEEVKSGSMAGRAEDLLRDLSLF